MRTRRNVESTSFRRLLTSDLSRWVGETVAGGWSSLLGSRPAMKPMMERLRRELGDGWRGGAKSPWPRRKDGVAYRPGLSEQASYCHGRPAEFTARQ
jgi:hypothetical protein